MNRLCTLNERAAVAKARRPQRSATRSGAAALLALMLWAAAEPGLARPGATPNAEDSVAPTASDQPTALLPVWALLDGDTPVAGARVLVYAIPRRTDGKPGRRRLLHPVNGVGAQRTYDSGVALLEFASLPRTFVVVVSGGQAKGRTLRGSLSAQVRAYRSGNVVHVTPVTSLVERWERIEPGVNRARARATVYRALGIPRWADGIDLRATNRWFDGDVFLERERGRLDRVFATLLGEIRGGASMRFQPAAAGLPGSADDATSTGFSNDCPSTPTDPGTSPTGPDGPATSPTGPLRSPRPTRSGVTLDTCNNPIADWWKNVDVKKLITDGFTDLGLSLLKQGVEAGGKWLLGKLLDEWGLKDVKDFLLPKSDTQVILEILASLNQRVTELQITVESTKQAVSESQYSVLVAATNPQTAAIDQLTEDLAVVASMPPESATRVTMAKDVVRRIRQELYDKNVARTLHQALDNPAPNANDILKAASQVYGTRRWVTAQSSANVETIHQYFALYQFRLAILLTNYWNTEPDTFSPATVQRFIDGINVNIDTQRRERLKPPVPDDKFIDTRTMLMWDRKPAWVSGEQYRPREQCRCTREGHVCERNNPNWADRNWADRAKGLGTEEDFRRLIDGWEGDNPLEWLRKQVGFVTSSPNPHEGVGDVWLGPHPVPLLRFGFIGCGSYTITRINLRERDRPGPRVFQNTLYDKDPQNYFAHAMTRQSVAPGTYWWAFGGR
jgi:hypothetical protein